MPLWRAGGWRSSELWWNLTADLCCHKRTGETYKSVKTEPHKTRELLAKSYKVKVLSSFFPQHLDVLHPFWTQHSHATFTCHYKNTFFKVYTVSALPPSLNIKKCNSSHLCLCWCRLRTTQVCSWKSSTTFYEVCWMGWQRCRSLRYPCCSALWWRPPHCLGLDPPSTPLQNKMIRMWYSDCWPHSLLYSCYAMKNATVILQVSRFGSQFKGI